MQATSDLSGVVWLRTGNALSQAPQWANSIAPGLGKSQLLWEPWRNTSLYLSSNPLSHQELGTSVPLTCPHLALCGRELKSWPLLGLSGKASC